MLEILTLVLFCWLFFKAVKLAFRAAWGVTKIVASLLFVIAWPLMIGCLLFAGGVVLILPVVLIAAAFGLLKMHV